MTPSAAGADIASLRDPAGRPQALAVRAEEALAAFPRPTLAAVRGYCVGGGSQLAAACDLRFAEEGASFGVTPAKLGIVYPSSSTRRLVALVGPAAAKFLLFSGELIGTERALRTGLVDEVLPAGALVEPGGRLRGGPGVALAADPGRGQGVRRRPGGPGRPLGGAGTRQQRHRRGGRRLPGAPYPPLHLDDDGECRARAYVRMNRLFARHSSTMAAGAFSGAPQS